MRLRSLLAQAGTGTAASTITGVVRDSSGGAIPGATVRVVNEATGVAVEAVSDEQGSYRVAALLPGQYRVETTLDGFEAAVRRVRRSKPARRWRSTSR